jgi:hypothetical protein
MEGVGHVFTDSAMGIPFHSDFPLDSFFCQFGPEAGAFFHVDAMTVSP